MGKAMKKTKHHSEVNAKYLAFISKNSPSLTPEKIDKFLEVLRTGKSVQSASRAAGVSRVTAFAEKARNEAFAEAWEAAYEAGSDAIEDVALERAFKSSDFLMGLMLKARRPDKYVERRLVDMNQNINVSFTQAREELAQIPYEQIKASLALLEAPTIENEAVEAEAESPERE